jgi:hypothetical protein
MAVRSFITLDPDWKTESKQYIYFVHSKPMQWQRMCTTVINVVS